MINSFLISFKLKNAYKVNSIIYSLKQIPIIKKILPSSLYKSKGLKVFANIISALIEFNSIFLGKLLYILFMIVLALSFYKNNSNDIFIHIFVFLTIIGGFLNTHLFNPSKDKYYAIILMKFDAKEYTLSNYYYFLLKVLIGFLPLTVIFGLISNVELTICLLLPVFIVCVKTIISASLLYIDNKKNKIRNENLPMTSAIVTTFILLACAYGLPLIGVIINADMFYLLFLISFIMGVFALNYIKKFNNYKKMYKELLTPNNVIFMNANTTKNISIDTYRKQINDEVVTSNSEGYEYFNDIFVKRHKKILTKASRNISVISALIFAILIAFAFINGKYNKNLNEYLQVSLPYFLFIMYFLNRGQNVTQTMFMNCDHSMLFYRFYRQPSAILKLFRERLKTLIKLNIIPALIIASGLTLLIYATGGAVSNINYLLTFLTIISMSIFFSVHHLVLYYLLQPYNIDLELNNPLFSIISSGTYLVCYFAIQVQIPTIIFGTAMIMFTIIYSLIALFLAYKYAPKTFKLRN